MKIRSDFVTNSSSSSFIVVFNNEEEAKASYQKMIDEGLNEEFAKVIYEDILNNRKTYQETLEEIIQNVDVYSEYIRLYGKSSGYRFWEDKRYHKLKEDARKRIVKAFKERVPEDRYIAIIEYGDDDGEFYSTLEHDIMPQMNFVDCMINNH